MALGLRRRHRRRVSAFCGAMLGSAEAGEAAAAATLAAAPGGGRLGLYRLAFELCRGRPGNVPEPAGIAGDLARLPYDQRAAILLRQGARLSHEQIATVMGASAAAVPPLLVAARLSLADAAAARRAGDDAIDSSVNWVESRAA